MKTMFLAIALALSATLVVAEDTPKTEPAPKAFDRGDAAAEKILKRAYTRVASAEAKGLERMLAEAKVTFDLSKSKLPLKVPPCDGRLAWQAGHTPLLDLDDPVQGYRISQYCENAFQPYVFFVFGLPGWDNFFKEANFKFVDAPKDIPEDGAKDKFVAVTFSDVARGTQTFQVRDTTIIAINFQMDIMDSPATARLIFTYEDKGKDLRIIQIDTDADVMMIVPEDEEEAEPKEAEKPKDGEEAKPEMPETPKKKKTNIQQTVKLTEYATAGKAEVCSKMEAEISVDFGASKLEFPATLELKNIKANKDVSDDDLKTMLLMEEIRAKAKARAAEEGTKEKPKDGEVKPRDGEVKPKQPEEKET
ncbi:MAG: hypothetical protein IT462_02740 [Planctomycetes bacterium]|nr:hypothetical protein [Planctomycetota bacterium]